MAVKFSNNAATTLSSAITASATTIAVADASGFPTLNSGDHTFVTIDSDSSTPTREVVRVTAISGNNLTVTRGQDNTTASAFDAGVKVELRMTAALLNSVSDEASTTDWADVANKPDPTVTLSGDVSGAGTLTDVGDVTITTTVADNSHAHTIANVTGLQTAIANSSNWDTAYSWGDHSSEGYLTSYTETDTLDSVTDRGATTTNAISTGAITSSSTVTVSGDITVNTSAFFADASSSRVGIGNASPSNALHITDSSPTIRLEDSDGTGGQGIAQIQNTANGNLRLIADPNNDGASSSSIEFEIDGAEIARFRGTGRLGINTPSPSYQLDVQGASDPAIRVMSTGTTSSDDAIVRIQIGGSSARSLLYFGDTDSSAPGRLRYDHSDDSLEIFTNGAEAIHITSAQDVGIGGTPASTYRLDVIDSGATLARIRSTADSDVSQYFYSAGTTATHNIYFGDTGNTAAGGIRYYHNGDNLTFTGRGSGTEMARFDSSGRFGIGTTAPAYTLDVASSLHIQNDGSTGFTHSRLIFDSNGSVRGAGSFMHNQVNSVEWFAGNPYNQADAFAITRNATATHADATSNVTNALMIVRDDGRVGIGTNAPNQLLDVEGTTDPSIRVASTGTASSDDAIMRIQIGGTSASSFLYFGDSDDGDAGRLRYNHSTDELSVNIAGVEEFRFASGGTFHADADIVAYSTTVASDAALKYNIEPVENALDKLNSLDGVTFQWRRDDKASAGVIAQDVEKVMPSAVKEVESLNGGSTHKAVDYNQIIALLIEAVKDQQAQIDELKQGR